MYFKTCEKCGAHLDPGEKCDCETSKNTEENGGFKNERN